MTSEMLVLRVSSFRRDGQGGDHSRGEFIEHDLTERKIELIQIVKLRQVAPNVCSTGVICSFPRRTVL